MVFSFCSRFFLCATLVVFSCFSAISSDKEEFYIFDVGQGNSQFAVYKSGIGVLYDCGSSSVQLHPKIASLQDHELNTFFGRKKPKLQQIINLVQEHKFLVSKENFLEEESGNFSEEQDNKRKLSDSSETLSNKASFALKNREKNIKDTIEKHKLKHLFIILSHPDKDHINFINKKVIPEFLPATAFLFGDWLGKGGENSKGNALSQDVGDVLTFLRDREDTWVELPHYWNGIKTIKTKISYKDIRDKWQLDKSNKFEETYDFCKRGTIESSIDFLNLYQSLDRTLSKNHDKDKIFYNHFKTLNIDFDPNSYYYGTDVMDDLKNIKITHLNVPFKDVNSQSAVIEIKMPDLKMQFFFLTGDAHEETFALIEPYNNKELFFKKEEGFISLVMLPHHGSLENKSYSLFELFKPDILGIPAGNGGMYSHPSRQLIKELEKKLEEENYQTNFYNLFEERGLPNDFIYFYEKKLSKEKIPSHKKKERIAHLHLHKQENEKGYMNIPIICTNVHGTIKIDSDGFKSPFASSVETEKGDDYLVDYSSRVIDDKIVELGTSLLKDILKKSWEEESAEKWEDKLQEELQGNSLLIVEGKMYYGVQTKKNTYIYNTIRAFE